MKKYMLYVFALLLLSLLIIAIIKSNKEIKYNRVVLGTKENVIHNTTDKKFLDTILYVGLNKLNIDSSLIVIKYLSESDKNKIEDFRVEAMVQTDGRMFLLKINKNITRRQGINAIAHELIHIEQFSSKRLITANSHTYWENRLIDSNSIPYQERPWEIEAFKKEIDLSLYIKEVLVF